MRLCSYFVLFGRVTVRGKKNITALDTRKMKSLKAPLYKKNNRCDIVITVSPSDATDQRYCTYFECELHHGQHMDTSCLPVSGDKFSDLLRLQTAHRVEFVSGEAHFGSKDLSQRCTQSRKTAEPFFYKSGIDQIKHSNVFKVRVLTVFPQFPFSQQRERYFYHRHSAPSWCGRAMIDFPTTCQRARSSLPH